MKIDAKIRPMQLSQCAMPCMYMYVCMYECMYVCVYECMLRMHACMNVCYVCVYKCMRMRNEALCVTSWCNWLPRQRYIRCPYGTTPET